MNARVFVCTALMWLGVPPALPGDWTNDGGNAARNGLSSETGPARAELLWSGGRPSLISWLPVTEGGRVFMVRQASSLPGGEPEDSPVVAMDIDTGAELWAVHLPFEPGDYITWVAGVHGGRVFASRSGLCNAAKLYALDAASGAELWTSQETIGDGDCGGLGPGAYEGVVFAPDGDLIIGQSRSIKRIDFVGGTTVWSTPRQCGQDYSCGVALFGDGVYAIEDGISRYDLATGVLQYSSGEPIGFGQAPPMVGNDGTIYVGRANNAPGENFFYAFRDSGASIEEMWRVPVGFGAFWEFGVGPDDSVYMLGDAASINRLDPATGAVLHSSPPLVTPVQFLQPRIAVDAAGHVFVSNGLPDGRLFAFEADLTPLWDVAVPSPNIGGPALGERGTLIIAGIGNDVRAYRTACSDDDGDGQCCSDENGDGRADDACCSSNRSETVVVDGCDSGVPNVFSGDGCSILDGIAQCAEGATNHGQVVSCVSHLTNTLKAQEVITGEQKSRIQRCVAQSQPRPSARALRWRR